MSLMKSARRAPIPSAFLRVGDSTGALHALRHAVRSALHFITHWPLATGSTTLSHVHPQRKLVLMQAVAHESERAKAPARVTGLPLVGLGAETLVAEGVCSVLGCSCSSCLLSCSFTRACCQRSDGHAASQLFSALWQRILQPTEVHASEQLMATRMQSPLQPAGASQYAWQLFAALWQRISQPAEPQPCKHASSVLLQAALHAGSAEKVQLVFDADLKAPSGASTCFVGVRRTGVVASAQTTSNMLTAMRSSVRRMAALSRSNARCGANVATRSYIAHAMHALTSA